MKLSPKQLNIIAWLLSAVVCLLAIVAWGSSYSWHFPPFSAFFFFPILGLLAFSLMWTHYIMSVLRQHSQVDKEALKKWFGITSAIVLVAIALHPGLLVWHLWRGGFGLPPGSYLQHYVAPSMRIFAVLGTVSWFIFIAYEFHRQFGKKSWWKYMAYATDIAMLAIFIHSLKLGSQLQNGWFRGVWIFYGLTLVLSLWYIYARKFGNSARPK
jgi:hypothetical protein